MPTNYSFRKMGFQHELETEIQRVIALICHAEERLEVQQRLLSELRGKAATSTQVELTMHVYRELVGELKAHLADLNELKG
jgi:hypothetical protein